MPERDPTFEADRMITTLTGFMVVALALLIGFGRETVLRHNAPPAIEVCHVSATANDHTPRACRGGDCPASDVAAREQERMSAPPAGLDAVWRALRAGAG
ncbi:MAG TPA: hypothetical protein VNQ50_00710 [Xanthobacteraceae bacterium]|nr:hypothetical protein [Xanthobacteraceae bacterium]